MLAMRPKKSSARGPYAFKVGYGIGVGLVPGAVYGGGSYQGSGDLARQAPTRSPKADTPESETVKGKVIL